VSVFSEFFSLGWLLKLSLIVIVEVRELGDLPDHIKLCVSLYFVFGCNLHGFCITPLY